MAPRTGNRGGKSGHQVPGKGVIVEAVNKTGGFPKRYKGLNWDEKRDQYPNMMRGKIGEDLAEAAARMRGEDVIASQVKVHRPDATSTQGSSNIDHVVRMPDGRYEGVEVKTGDATLTKNQEEHYPKVPQGGLKLMTDKLDSIGMPYGHVLNPGDISSVRLERWDIEKMPDRCKSVLDQYTVADILDGKAGKDRADEFRNWISGNPPPYKIEKRW